MSRRRRRTGPLAALALLLSIGLVGGCGFGGSIDRGFYPYWVLNDTSHPVTIDLQTEFPATLVVPPHTYGALFEAHDPIDSAWTVGLVDDHCAALIRWSFDPNKDLIYIPADGPAQLQEGLAWDVGLRSATAATLNPRRPRCP